MTAEKLADRIIETATNYMLADMEIEAGEPVLPRVHAAFLSGMLVCSNWLTVNKGHRDLSPQIIHKAVTIAAKKLGFVLES